MFFIYIMLIMSLKFTSNVTKIFYEHFYLLYSCSAVRRDAGRRAGAAHGGDPVPTRGPLRGAALDVHALRLPAAALLHGGALPEAAGDGSLCGQAGPLRLPPRRGSEGKFLTFCYYSTDGSDYNFYFIR
jgi:hypothetical protein